MCNSENSLLIAGFGFKTEGFQNADTVKVSAFTLSLNKEPYPQYKHHGIVDIKPHPHRVVELGLEYE